MVVLPAHRTSRLARQPPERQADELCKAPLDAKVAARFVQHAEVLVEPDGDRRTDAKDETVCAPALRLGERSRARIEGAAERPPRPREVAVEVDAVRVLASAARVPVRIEVLDQPEVVTGRWSQAFERLDDREARAFVAVDAADHEHRFRAVHFSAMNRLDPTTLDRSADHRFARRARRKHGCCYRAGGDTHRSRISRAI